MGGPACHWVLWSQSGVQPSWAACLLRREGVKAKHLSLSSQPMLSTCAKGSYLGCVPGGLGAPCSSSPSHSSRLPRVPLPTFPGSDDGSLAFGSEFRAASDEVIPSTSPSPLHLPRASWHVRF